eukprot:TRINITY_DN7510_c0_g1_i2.p2 TRINITY_DN7510_c0_g1~~TRINITY_DN7510_c0_g1_i2.p2  ORF type:complete len:117 (+),score=17.97 TRINITY_DN7510_c0_g1_i2:159-509(+)
MGGGKGGFKIPVPLFLVLQVFHSPVFISGHKVLCNVQGPSAVGHHYPDPTTPHSIHYYWLHLQGGYPNPFPLPNYHCHPSYPYQASHPFCNPSGHPSSHPSMTYPPVLCVDTTAWF